MKVHEILEARLDEREALKRAAAAAAISAAALHGAANLPHKTRTVTQPLDVQKHMVVHHAVDVEKEQKERLAQVIVKRYGVDEDLAQQIVDLAHKHERATFPKATDILAVIGVESTFDPDAKSGLKKDPAVGLMQVRPGVWELDPEDVKDPEDNIKVGTDILAKYYKRFRGDKRKTLMAYNAGPDGMKTSDYAPVYADKVANLQTALAKTIKPAEIPATRKASSTLE